MLDLINKLKGYKTFLSAAGLAGLALYELSMGQYELAWQSFLLACVAAGLRDAIASK